MAQTQAPTPAVLLVVAASILSSRPLWVRHLW